MKKLAFVLLVGSLSAIKKDNERAPLLNPKKVPTDHVITQQPGSKSAVELKECSKYDCASSEYCYCKTRKAKRGALYCCSTLGFIFGGAALGTGACMACVGAAPYMVSQAAMIGMVAGGGSVFGASSVALITLEATRAPDESH